MVKGKMNEAARNARNLYYREWRKKNPEKVRESNERYWLKKAAEMEGVQDETSERVDSSRDSSKVEG